MSNNLTASDLAGKAKRQMRGLRPPAHV